MNSAEIKNKILLAAKFFENQVYVSGKENCKNYVAGIEFLENLANAVDAEPEAAKSSEPESK